jgi:hypothetical protein
MTIGSLKGSEFSMYMYEFFVIYFLYAMKCIKKLYAVLDRYFLANLVEIIYIMMQRYTFSGDLCNDSQYNTNDVTRNLIASEACHVANHH